MAELRREVKEFADKMEYKLSLHDERPGWKNCDSAWLLSRLREETDEVVKVLEKKGDGWLTDLWMECADIANFAMMIQDAETSQWAKRKAKYAPAWVGGTDR